MTINLTLPNDGEAPDLKPRITVVGVGGAGGNAVNNMIRSQLEGVEFVVANTDAQAIQQSRAERTIQLGMNVTQGLGAGARADVGRAAAEETIEEIGDQIRNSNMVFIAAGMGGGTGTGAAPVIARVAREQGILTVGVVTKPFHFEGTHRMRIAETGIKELEQFVDTLIIIPNQNLFRVANERTTFADAFSMADNVLYSGVRGVTDLMVMPGLINLDFADIRSVMSEMGKAMMGTGEAEGERRALDAAEAAIANPLLDDASMNGARGVLINITGGSDMTLFEVDEAANRIRSEVDPEAYIIFGSTFDEALEGRVRVSVVATGMESAAQSQPAPTVLDVTSATSTQRVGGKDSSPRSGGGESGGGLVNAIAKTMGGSGMAGVPAASATATAEELNPVNVVDLHTAEPESEPEAAETAPSADPNEQTLSGPDADLAMAAAILADTDSAPPATPSVGGKDVFIPPQAADSGAAAQPSRPADPFAEADMLNGRQVAEAPKTPAKPKAPSLFERVTGTGRAAKPAAQPKPSQDAQGSLSAPDPSERLGGSQSEDDLLDIPAFLRRQAN